ncbi:transmembrane ascorbate-dependent reductase CYB561-like [Planococcus citri]|uniref:transmembrane ascorbate-dependent reductase CYB561-like n=1 Tax=Planococcus citri TaxID=170843 RepID=UPI0031FA4378
MFLEYILGMKMSGVLSRADAETMAEPKPKVETDLDIAKCCEITLSKEENCNAKENLKGFLPLIVVAQFLGLLPILFIIYWAFSRAGGMVHCVLKMSNLHIILSSISFVYLMGNSILTFRILRNWPKNTLKMIHALIGGLNCILTIVSVWAAFNFHARAGSADLYSVHSWIGMITLIMYITQVVAGFYSFLYPGISAPKRTVLMPYHRFAGQALLALSVLAAVTGINEKAIFMLGKCYEEKALEGILLNLSSVLFTLFAIVVIYTASSMEYKRYPRLEDDLSSPIKVNDSFDDIKI